MSRRITPKTAADWGAVIPQWLGVFGLLAQLVIWATLKIITGEDAVQPALLTAFGGLIVAGQGLESLAALRSPQRPEDAPKPDEEAKR